MNTEFRLGNIRGEANFENVVVESGSEYGTVEDLSGHVITFRVA
jgi:hypothetical protein